MTIRRASASSRPGYHGFLGGHRRGAAREGGGVLAIVRRIVRFYFAIGGKYQVLG